MYKHLWKLLEPFHRDYTRYLVGIAFRQALLVGGGYALIWALRLCLQRTGLPEWGFVIAFIAYDIGLLRLDIRLNNHFVSRLGFPLYGHLRTSALAKVFQMPLDWHQRQNTGALVGKVNNGVGKVVQTAESIGRELAPAVIRTALSLVPLLYFSPFTAPALLAAFVLFFWLTIKEEKERHPLRKNRNENYNNDFGLFAESVQYVKPVLQFGQTGRILQRYERVQSEIISDGLEEVRIGNAYSWKRNLALSVVKRGCQGVWIWQYRKGALDAALVFYLNMITEELLNSFWSYASLLDRLYDALEPTRTLVSLLDEPNHLAALNSGSTAASTGLVGIDMVNIGFSYTQGSEVMKDFNLCVKAGTILGVVGPSGGGKTTIHNLLSRMFEIHEGQILVAGQDIRKWPVDRLRGLFSYVTQSDGVFLSGTTLFETIRFARPEATNAEVEYAARAACIHDDIIRMPLGYDSIVGEKGQTLSKGQQQRIALAQALVALSSDRKVLILDEFTSAIDSRTERQIMRNLVPYFVGRTVVIIAHRLSTVRNLADRIVVVANGSVVEEGSHAELIGQDGWYAENSRIQAVATSQ
jgi:ABC-type multidrug transport system fused ATPase/permease subunit